MNYGRDEIERAKRQIKKNRILREYVEYTSELNRIAQEELDAEDTAGTEQQSESEPTARGLTFSEIRDAFQASLAEAEERGQRGSKVNVAKRLGVSESTLVRAWSELHGGDPPEWPTGLNP
jgi:DNA-binding NtrC family response regulator